MEIVSENILRFAEPSTWRCMVDKMDESGNVTITVLNEPPGRSRLQILIRDVIYQEVYGEWSGINISVATKNDLLAYIPKLGNNLREKSGDEYISNNYHMYVIEPGQVNNLFIARDVLLDRILP